MPQRITNIHDKFVKDLLSQKELAIAFLQEYLPGEVAQILVFESLSYQNTSYLSNNLKASYADMVWRVNTTLDFPLQICLLLEHKSYIDPQVNFQILEYLALAYQKQWKEKKPLELIVPILYYHGTQHWDYKPLISHFEQYPHFLHKYLPAYLTEFVNLQAMNGQHIQQLKHGLLRTALSIQRYYFDHKELNHNIEQILDSLNPYLDSNFIDVIFVYLLQNDQLDKESFKEKLQILPPDLNKKAMSIYDELIQEGIEKGKAEGLAEGIEKTILNAFDNGISFDIIRMITGESDEKIRDVLKKNGRG
ncbi:Rpn family recombination-promoting nuclease/putative transposase [Arundinibacter roseus]|uniref:Rpn family recombination-promoting nuclease/putative transposase n=2 Tax=Arundinibacter roseus TaxID=2070510 RepID=A0A4V2X7T5_9BACT|nr:Rpn family recombination-promoting nuclease/putative transposase [Arundinibacter roseus]